MPRFNVDALFRRVDEGAKSPLEANPPLQELVESDCGQDCKIYRDWVRRGRRGPKPRLAPGDGRFDPINVGLDRKGGRRVASWVEALHATVPPSRHWQEFDERLPFLEEAAHMRLELPEEAERLELQRAEIERCRAGEDAALEDLFGRARVGRLRRTLGGLAGRRAFLSRPRFPFLVRGSPGDRSRRHRAVTSCGSIPRREMVTADRPQPCVAMELSSRTRARHQCHQRRRRTAQQARSPRRLEPGAHWSYVQCMGHSRSRGCAVLCGLASWATSS